MLQEIAFMFVSLLDLDQFIAFVTIVNVFQSCAGCYRCSSRNGEWEGMRISDPSLDVLVICVESLQDGKIVVM